MDRLAQQLRDDAEKIDVAVSPELDERIRASLAATNPEPAGTKRPAARPAWFWWASSLTGVAAAIVVVAVLNLRPPEPATDVNSVANPTALLPPIDWQVETAVLTSPLEQEYEDLQSDIRKAEKALREDLDAILKGREEP